MATASHPSTSFHHLTAPLQTAPIFSEKHHTNIVNNGATISTMIDQDPNAGSFIWLNGQKYYLLHLHFHAASVTNGERRALPR
ncbi:MAG: hypothetical protein IPM82_16595 [Saprospiraceae bacterium]|nr:hypothetical protein [Saprospiraceae bacterium]